MLDLDVLTNPNNIIAAEKCIRGLVKVTQKVFSTIESDFEVQNQEMTISCPDGIQKNSLILKAKPRFKNRRLEIKSGIANYVSIRPIIGNNTCSNVITQTETGFNINIGSLENEGLYLLDYEYNIDIANFIKSMVDMNRTFDTPIDENPIYWMEAKLKHPSVLRSEYGSFDLRNIDFNIDMNISGDIKTSIPSVFQRELNAAIEILKETDPRTTIKRRYKYLEAKGARGHNRDDILEVIASLQTLFEPREFAHYVDVVDDFKYTTCQRGANYHERVPFQTWPKFMKVVSRTDLNLNKCAANGRVIYHKYDFQEEIEKIFGK